MLFKQALVQHKDEKCLPQTNAAGTEITDMKINTPESPYTSCILQPSVQS